jgi:hypothetical protein
MVTGMASGPCAARSAAGLPTASAAEAHPAWLWSSGPNVRSGEVTLADAINAVVNRQAPAPGRRRFGAARRVVHVARAYAWGHGRASGGAVVVKE